MSDRLALSNAIEDAGIERAKAERVASVIVDLIHDQVATKADVRASEAGVRADLQALETSLRGEMASLRGEMTSLRGEMRTLDASVAGKISGRDRLCAEVGLSAGGCADSGLSPASAGSLWAHCSRALALSLGHGRPQCQGPDHGLLNARSAGHRRNRQHKGAALPAP